MLAGRFIQFAGDETSSGGGGGGGTVVPLKVVGLNVKQGSDIWKYHGITAFRAPELYAQGKTAWLDDYFGWAKTLGVNSARVFCLWNNTRYSPITITDYYTKFLRFLEWMKSHGLYVHVVAFCDQVPTSSVLLSEAQQNDHIRIIVDACRTAGNVLLEVSNEDFKNGHVSARFPPETFAGVLSTRSTWYTHSDEDPETPGTWLDWVTVHPGGDPEWAYEGPKILYEAQKGGLGNYPPARRPSLIGEPRRIAEGTTPRQWADHAFHADNFGAGSLIHGGFHSLPQATHHESDLQNCKIPTGLALECCEAVRDVWLSGLINLEAAEKGRYLRGQQDGGGECPIVHKDIDDGPDGCGRSYFMEVDGVMYGGAIDPGPQNYGAVAREGWRIEKQGGYTKDGRGGNVLELHR